MLFSSSSRIFSVNNELNIITASLKVHKKLEDWKKANKQFFTLGVQRTEIVLPASIPSLRKLPPPTPTKRPWPIIGPLPQS